MAAPYDNYGLLSVDLQLTSVPTNLVALQSSVANWRSQVNTNPTYPDITPPIIDTEFLALPTPVFNTLPGALMGGGGGGAFGEIRVDDIAKFSG